MKRISAIGALLSCMAIPVFATGPYDGIYVNLSTVGSYFSIHTNGNSIIGTAYGIIPASGIQFSSAIGNVYPKQLNTWDLYHGSINGSSATFSGQDIFNACNVTLSVTFTATGATGFITTASQTPVGASSGVNCSALPSLTPNGISFQKAF